MFIRVNHDQQNPFVVLNKGFLNDKKLSYRAKGLMALLLSFPNDWQVYEKDLKTRSTDRQKSTHSALLELMNNGYLIRRENNQERINRGRFAGYNYDIYESKQLP